VSFGGADTEADGGQLLEEAGERVENLLESEEDDEADDGEGGGGGAEEDDEKVHGGWAEGRGQASRVGQGAGRIRVGHAAHVGSIHWAI
jgi:hypothetical protein